ncbi:serine kinase [Donghicola sp. C2-DW-16]|uniref:Serine kinase n=2 Tax=Donghicola mangrovi TaxID=2729614 RepID=A0ABX2PI39_9RHOB|nr:serine kinase [Donghicola mangrovi]
MVHASTVMAHGSAVVLFGPSGAGKSGLALEMMALGAGLVADDRTILTRDGDRLIATCPDTIRGRIEARGVGILRADAVGSAPVTLFVDMQTPEVDRLPTRRVVTVFGLHIPLLQKVERGYFAAALMQYLSKGLDEE